MSKVVFKETQQFRQWWYILLILITTIPAMLFSLYALYQQIVNGVQVGDTPPPDIVLAIIPFAMGVMLWGYFSLKLEVRIDETGLHYKFFPLILKERTISKEEIDRYEIRNYNAILEYGGWGIKGSFISRRGKAYNVSGNTGLQLYLKNGKKILFGTQRSQAILYAMNNLFKVNN